MGQANGPIRVRGGIGIAELTRPSFDLRLVATNARVLDNDLGRINADANIGIQGPFEAVYVTGTANIRNGVIYAPTSDSKDVINADDPAMFAVVDTSVVADRETLPAQSALLENLRVDVTLNVSRDTWVRSREANVEIYTPERYGALTIHVDRGRQALALEGVVNADRGTYEFMGRRFEINRGSATFIGDPEINPLLQITAVHEVTLAGAGALDIEVVIGGTLRSPKLTLAEHVAAADLPVRPARLSRVRPLVVVAVAGVQLGTLGASVRQAASWWATSRASRRGSWRASPSTCSRASSSRMRRAR